MVGVKVRDPFYHISDKLGNKKLVYPSLWLRKSSKICKSRQNSGRQNGDVKQVPYRRSTNIRRYRKYLVARAVWHLGFARP
jgi:hypothetical protein